jgi:hypothetical protein
MCYSNNQLDSDVLHVNFIGQHVVILNSAQAAIDLLDKRSNIYSDRPDFEFFKEYLFFATNSRVSETNLS